MSESPDYFGDHRPALKGFIDADNHLSKIEPGFGQLSDQELHKALVKLVKQAESGNDSGIRGLAALIVKGRKLAEQMTKAITSHVDSWSIEDKLTDSRHEADRRRRWKLYRDSVLRWCLSATIAVILYSVAVNLAEWNDLIHVPVHDWIGNSKEGPPTSP